MTDLALPPLKTASSGTLPISTSVDVTPAPAANWHVATLANLSQVEDLLDCLEARGIAEREVVTLENDLFAVRWR
ncbi:MAG TPA: hypothetical protein VFG68_05630 [Fimbriiglobus sp.]|nr:hypothetical protein [Fimbriiglobus sp.]